MTKTTKKLEIGKVPPQAVDLEEVVLGAMLIDTKAADDVFNVIRMPEVFYKDAHRFIYTAIANLYNTGNPVDLLTVSEELRKIKKLEASGGDFYLINLTQKVASSAHTEYHSRIILQKYLKRSVIVFNAQITALAFDDTVDTFDLLDRWQKEFDSVIDITRTGRETISFIDSLQELKKNVERLSANTDDIQLVGLPTGFQCTDKHTGGYQPTDLVIIAARPGMGKTSKVLKTVAANLRNGTPVGMFSLEMSMQQLTARIVAIETDFHLKQLLKTGFEKTDYFQTYDAHCKRLNNYPLVVDDSGVNDITEIVIIAKAWVRKYGIKLLVIDYLQLMDNKNITSGNREAVTSSISRRMKLLAKELQIPILLLSQLSRAVETRGGSKRPLLSDLRDSGAIEQDADIVEFIYRPDYYELEVNIDDYEKPHLRNAVAQGANSEIIFAKFRGGSTGVRLLKWVGDKTKFIDVEDSADTADYIDSTIPTATPEQAFGNDDNDTPF